MDGASWSQQVVSQALLKARVYFLHDSGRVMQSNIRDFVEGDISGLWFGLVAVKHLQTTSLNETELQLEYPQWSVEKGMIQYKFLLDFLF